MDLLSWEESGRWGWEPARLRRAFDRLDDLSRTGRVPAASLCVGSLADDGSPVAFTHRTRSETAPIDDETTFLVASLTKPIVVTAAMLLVERGVLGLDDRVGEYLPTFSVPGKDEILVRHLMTHTSGLPDQVPENEALRVAGAPLSAFVEATSRQALAFAPGTQVRYQSMGTLLLGEIVAALAGKPLPEFLDIEVFGPLGMSRTRLGCRPEEVSRVAPIRVASEAPRTDHLWNTPYWLTLGAPWGGLISTADDLGRFCALMLAGGRLSAVRLLAPATVEIMTRNQLDAMPALPEIDRRTRPWGLGWRLNWPGHSAHFGDLLGPKTYGHWGATGTVFWVSPEARCFAVLLTTQPQGDDGRWLARISNAVVAARTG